MSVAELMLGVYLGDEEAIEEFERELAEDEESEAWPW